MRTFVAAGLIALALAAPVRAQTAQAPSADREQVAAAQAALAMKLLAPHAGDAQAVVSPASLTSAVAIVALGASPAMKAALMQALSFPNQPQEDSERQLREARAALMKADPAVFVTADRFVNSPREPLSPGMIEKFVRNGVDHVALDLGTAPGVAAVNAWVKKATRGEIDRLLDGPDPTLTYVAINAMYIKAKWKTPFEITASAVEDFVANDGKRGRVRMMHRQGYMAARAAAGFVGVDLPFAGERYAMTIVTTTDDPSSLAQLAEVGDWLSAAEFSLRPVDLSLPRFGIDTNGSLLPALRADLEPGLKSPAPFEDFGPSVQLADILQRTKVEVDEQGAKAVAVTGLPMHKSPMPPMLRIVFDKPFLFALRDRDSGLILVAGYVGQAPKD